MPPPISRPTILNATRASIVDEKKRFERCAKIQTRSDKGISQSKSKVFGTTVPRTASEPQVFYTPREGRRGIPEDEGKSPPITKPTFLSATRASIADEKKRLERYAEIQPRSVKGIVQSKCKVFGTTVSHAASKPQDFFAFREERRGIPEDEGKSRGIDGHFSETGIRYDTGKNIVKQATDDKECDPEKDRDVSSPPSGATGDSSSTGILPVGDKVSASEEWFYHDNLDFYKNKTYSKPAPGHKIEEMLKWKGNYDVLERNNRCLQWLFPTSEGNGSNLYAQQLYEHEAKAIRDDDTAHKRVLSAFKMMLDFYGMQLANSIHGTLKRSSKGWEERYDHLNRSRHNHLRITRILKSIGELGYERLQAPWVDFLIDEAVNKKVLPNLNGPCLMHWIIVVKDNGEREMLYMKVSGLFLNQDNALYGTNSEPEGAEDEEVVERRKEKVSDQDCAALSKLVQKKCENKTGSVAAHFVKHVLTGAVVSKPKKAAASLSRHTHEKSDEEQKKHENPTMDKTEYIYKKSVKRWNTMSLDESICWKQSPSESLQGSDNLKFYQNKLLSRPSPGYTVETMLRLKGQHSFFDDYPGFIHWLFPIPETTGKNAEAQPLYEYEANAIRNDDELICRVREAFEVMLDFFGMAIRNDLKGIFRRNKRTYNDRYEYLQRYKENYFRITRIIISIGELGLERFQVPWVTFLISEGIDNAMFPTLDGQCIKHWICAIKDDGEKHAMFSKYQSLLGHKAPIAFKEE